MMSGVDVRHGHRHRHAAAVLHLSGVQIWKVATQVHALAESTRGGPKGSAAVAFAFSASGLFYHHLRTIFGVGVSHA